MTRCLLDLARRPGTAISCLRIVAVVALAWKTEAMAPVARVLLNAIAATTSQALLAAKDAEGRCARAPDFRSAMTCSTIAWPRWDFSAHSADALLCG
jgi:predicted secreted Zn-dependent protease